MSIFDWKFHLKPFRLGGAVKPWEKKWYQVMDLMNHLID